MPQQLAHVRAIVRVQGNPDADRGHQRAPVDDHGGAQGIVDAPGRLVDLLGVRDPLQDHHEFVPAHAHDHVLGAHGRADALRHGLQQLVAGLVAARVVHVLEAVEVQEQHGEHAVVALRLGDRLGQVRLQVQAVRQAGELVVVRQAIELLVLLEQVALDLAAHGDIVHRHGEDGLVAEA